MHVYMFTCIIFTWAICILHTYVTLRIKYISSKSYLQRFLKFYASFILHVVKYTLLLHHYIKLTQILPPKNWLSKVPQNGSLSHLPLAWFPIKSDHVGMASWQKLNKRKGQLELSMGKLKVIIKTCIYEAAPLTQPRKCWERPCAHQSRPLEPDLLACFSIITCGIRTVEGNYDSYRSER